MNRPEHDDDQPWDPLDAGSASLPPVLGGGCLARFDPASLKEWSGTDFAAVPSESDH